MKYLLFIVLLVAVVMTAGCVGSKETVVTPTPQIVYITVLVTPPPIATTISTQNSLFSRYKVGDSVSDNLRKITIEKVSVVENKILSGTGYQLAINYSIQNLQTDKLLDSEGYSVFDSTGHSYYPSYSTFNGNQILPDEIRRGRDLLNIPRNATGFNIRFTLNDGKIVIFDV